MQVATLEATCEFAKKFSYYKDFYIKHNNLFFSKLGLGTFNKEPYKEENYVFHYIEGVKQAVRSGVNVIDTASNYRYGQSEKEIAIALEELIKEDEIKREELIICSKGGFIPLSYPFPKNPYQWIKDNILKVNLAKEEDIELDQHCMTPDFLEWSCKNSLKNLKISSIDIYFLHNPEIQIQRLGYEKFLEKIEGIFIRFEELVQKGLIKSYGVAVWNAFINKNNHSEHINLEDLVNIAKRVAGKDHNLKYIQTPFNMGKTSINTLLSQEVKKKKCTLLQAASRLNIAVISSSSLLQMNLFKRSIKAEIGFLLDKENILKSDIQLALQFVRSTPGILSSLFASKVPVHIKSNLEISKIKKCSLANYNLIYKL